MTAFDDEGMIQLPEVTGTGPFDYIAIYTGTGTNDIDASDGNATVYLGLDARILDPTGDEIGFFDGNGDVIDFMRYDGGNGDELFDDWDSGDEGPILSNWTHGSISLFGVDADSSINWLQSMTTPSSPNAYMFLAEDTLYEVIIVSGVNAPYSFIGDIDDKVSGINVTVNVVPAPGVDANTTKLVQEHIAFSLKFYEEKGFTRGPKTMADGKIKITLTNGTKSESVGSASNAGTIKIDVGKIDSKIDLKYVCEHELMHLFQYKYEGTGNEKRDHTPYNDKFWIEGQATYWGIESTKANYNLTNEEIQNEFDRVGDHNWFDHYTDLNRSVFKGWGKSYDDYMGSYLLMKFLAEKYGEDKLKEAFDKAVDSVNNSLDVNGPQALAEVLGKTWEEIVAEFHAWMMTDAIKDNGVPERPGNVEVTYSNNTISDSALAAGWGALVERIKVNSTQPFKITLDAPEGSKWKITVIYVYEDGSREQCPGTPYDLGPSYPHWVVNPGANGKKLVEVILVKSLVQDAAARTNMTATPIPFPGPQQITTNGGPIYWELPPSLLNSTILDWPWSWTWEYNLTDDLFDRIIEINTTSFVPDSFFDVFVEIDNTIR